MGPALTEYSLVFVGPAPGQTAVGDYSEDFVSAVRPYFGGVVEVRTGGPLTDGVREIRRYRRAVRKAIANAGPCRVLVHAELAAGETGAFWSIAGLPDVPVTATIHDPPQGIWWPAGTKFLAKRRMLFHVIHYPMRPLSTAVEGAVNGRRTLFALTETGRRSIELRYPKTNPVYVPHIVRERPAIRPVQDRPKAIGFFGHVYRGKGFDQIERIRRELPDDILIRVAGRGTEALSGADGVEVVGAVEGPDEDAFFDSVRAIVIPYGKRHFYAETYPASSVAAHALAYRTPIVCTGYGSLAEFDEQSGVVVVPMDGTDVHQVPPGFSAAIASLVNDESRLTQLGKNADRTRQDRSAPRIAEAYAAGWSQMLASHGQR